MHSYRPGRPLPEIRSPGLLGGATPVERDGRAEFQTSLSGVELEASIPARPRLVLLSAGPCEISPELRESALVLNLSKQADWSAESISRVAARVSRLPETRGLPLVLAGAGAGSVPAAGASAAADRCAALLLDRPLDSVITLTPTYAGDPGGALAYLEDELGEIAAPGLDRARRRRLERMLHRRLRRDCRRRGSGTLNGRVRRGIGTLAAALSFALGMGLGTGTAQAAFSGTFNSGDLILTDGAVGSQLLLDCSAGAVTFNGDTTLPGIGAAIGCDDVKSIDATGGGGSDTIDLDAVESVTNEYEVLEGVVVAGGTGFDSLLGTVNVGGKLLGGDDTDVIYGSSGMDVIAGEAGDDFLDGDGVLAGAGDSADDDIQGGVGTDTLTQIDDRTGIDYGLDDSSFQGAGEDALSSIERASIQVSTGNNTISASGFSGSVTIQTGSGDDELAGGGGADQLTAGTGASDRLLAGSHVGDQTLTPTAHTASGVTDTLSGFEQASLGGSAGPNAINASAFVGGSVTMAGSGGNDTLTGSNLADNIDGVGGDDLLLAGSGGNDTLAGGLGTDTVQQVGTTQVLSDSQLTGQGTDGLSGIERAVLGSSGLAVDIDASAFSGQTTLTGSISNDLFRGSQGADSIDGGAGTFDRVDQSADVNMTLTNGLLTGVGNDIIAGIEAASLQAGNGDNLLNASGFTGDRVTLIAGAGDDTLMPANGINSDSLNGGIGAADRLVHTTTAASITVANSNIASSSGSDGISGIERISLTGFSNDQDFDASGFTLGSVTIAALGGNDTIEGTDDHADVLAAGTGTADQLRSFATESHVLADTSLGVGNAASDTLSDFDSASISSGSGPESLDAVGFTKPVTLFGNNGNDTLRGGSASDQLSGGAGVGIDRLEQTSDASSQVLTNTQLTGQGTDVINSFERVSLTGGALANSIDVSAFTSAASTGVTVSALGGDDDLETGGAKFSVFDGGAGDDSFDDNTGASLGGKVMIGGDGDDTISGSDGTDTITGDGGDDDISTSNKVQTVDGGSGGDTLIGTGMLLGGIGDDSLSTGALSATDSVVGGDGTDTFGRSGPDSMTLTGALWQGGTSTAELSGIERAVLGAGIADIDASGFTPGPVTLTGGTLIGSPNSDYLDGGSLQQTANVDQTLSNSLATGDGNDTLDTAGTGFNSAALTGGAAANDIDASAFSGNLTLSGGDANDTLAAVVDGTSLSLEGGNGTADRAEVTIDESTVILNDVSLGGQPHSGVENFSISGGAGDNNIIASAFTKGAVTLAGLGGSDTLTGTSFADVLDAGTQVDEISGGALADTLTGGAGDDDLDGEAGSDLLVETANADLTLTNASLQGLGNDDLASIESASLTGGAAANTFDASGFTAGPVSLDALAGNDVITGSPQNDLIEARDGASFVDQINCLAGNDTLNADDVDAAANCEANGAITDTTAPQTTIASGPANGETITTGSATFTFTSNEPGSFSCQLDGGAVEACGAGTSGSKAYSGLANGTHTFRVFATDSAGNAGASPATRTFTVAVPAAASAPSTDTSAPRLRVSGSKKQKSSRKIIVKATCANEACSFVARGKVKAGKKLKLKQAAGSGQAEEAVKLTLRVKGKKSEKNLKKAIKRGKTSKATIVVEATDTAGNTATGKRKVKVKKGK